MSILNLYELVQSQLIEELQDLRDVGTCSYIQIQFNSNSIILQVKPWNTLFVGVVHEWQYFGTVMELQFVAQLYVARTFGIFWNLVHLLLISQRNDPSKPFIAPIRILPIWTFLSFGVDRRTLCIWDRGLIILSLNPETSGNTKNWDT